MTMPNWKRNAAYYSQDPHFFDRYMDELFRPQEMIRLSGHRIGAPQHKTVDVQYEVLDFVIDHIDECKSKFNCWSV